MTELEPEDLLEMLAHQSLKEGTCTGCFVQASHGEVILPSRYIVVVGASINSSIITWFRSVRLQLPAISKRRSPSPIDVNGGIAQLGSDPFIIPCAFEIETLPE